VVCKLFQFDAEIPKCEKTKINPVYGFRLSAQFSQKGLLELIYNPHLAIPGHMKKIIMTHYFTYM